MMDMRHERERESIESTGMLIVRLEYESVGEDGELPLGGFVEIDGVYRIGASELYDGAEDCQYGFAHWAVFLFPRDAFGNVVGWFMLADSPTVFVDALYGLQTHTMLRLH